MPPRPNDIIPPARVREIRDLMLLYLYDHGGNGKLKQEVSIHQLKKELNLSHPEYLVGYNNLQARRLLVFPGTPNHIGINIDGQFEVETLGISNELSKRMAAQSEAQEKLQAEFDV